MLPVLTSELLDAVLAAKKEFPAIARTADNPFFKSKYATLDSILEIVEPILHKNGLFISQPVNGHTVVTRVYHVGGGFLESSYPLEEDLDAQKRSAAVTYARRSSIGSLLSLTLDDDDDGNSAVGIKAVPTVTPPGATSKRKIIF